MKKIIFSVIAVVLVAGGIFCYSYYQNKKFIETSNDVMKGVKDLAVLSLSVNSYYSTIWRNAIYHEKTYWEGGMYYRKDFNDALVTARQEMNPSIILIDAKTAETDSLMKLLNDRPSKYENIHSQIIKLYGLSSEFSSLAKSPQGSLMTFNQQTEKLSSEIFKLTKEIEIQLPSK